MAEKAEISGLLSRVGWTQRHFALWIGVDEDTVSRWVRKKRATPRLAILYLELLAERMGV